MAKIEVDDEQLTVELQGMHRLWALKRRITVPLAHVRGATADPGIVNQPKGVRAPGLHLPGVAVMGTFHREGETSFWDVRNGAHAVVIELTGERFARLVVDVADPRAAVGAINAAVAAP